MGPDGVKAARETFLAAAVLLALVCCGCGGEAPSSVLTADQQSELDTLAGQLADPARSARTKLEAASLMLTRPYPQAGIVLRQFLSEQGNPSAQRAVAEAIALRGGSNEAFVDPLMALLTDGEPAVRLAAGRALVSYGDADITEELIDIAKDDSQDRQLRRIVIRSLGSAMDLAAVEAMVKLLDDSDEAIRAAATESLGELTHIRNFGGDAAKWKSWWAENRDKDQSQWLADLADRLGKANAALTAQNARLADRLATAMGDLYAAAAAGQREAMLLGFMKDPLAEVRLAATALVDRRLGANEEISEDLRMQVRTMLADCDPRCRGASAVLLAKLGDQQSLWPLLNRLKAESDPSVHRAILAALGQLRRPEALPAVVAEISSPVDAVATAAAQAMARIAESHPLSDKTRKQAVKFLVERYEAASGQVDAEELQEALLTAMGSVADKRLADVVAGALGHKAATVRLAAVNALAKLGDDQSAALLAPLVAGDADRGVRQAAIAGLAALDGKEQLEVILKQTDPAAEADPAVRQQAWDVAMAILADADADTLAAVAESLAGRGDAADQRIKVLQMLVGALSGAGQEARADARRQLGLALVEAGRPAEAASHLAEAWKAYEGAGSKLAEASWRQWIAALLAADDPAAMAAMAGRESDDSFAAALASLFDRLTELRDHQKHSSLILLAEAALKELSHRLTFAQRQRLEQLLADGRSARAAADRLEVARLVGQLQASEESARKAAEAALKAMGERAIQPLLLELRKSVSTDPPNAKAETAIVGALVQVAPGFEDYDPSADQAAKVKLIEAALAARRRPEPAAAD